MLDELRRSRASSTRWASATSSRRCWLNADQSPLDSKAVRQALLYATDRQAIVDQIVKPSVREGRVLQSFIVPTFAQYFSPTFSEYSKDLGEGRRS